MALGPDHVTSSLHASRRRFVIGLVLVLVLIAAAIVFGGQSDAVVALRTANANLLAAAAGASLVSILLRFLRWQCCLNRVSSRVHRGWSLLIFTSGLAMILTPGRLGELIRCGYVHRATGVPASSTIPIIVAERMTEGLGMLVVAATAILAFILFRPVGPLHPMAIPGVIIAFVLVAFALFALRQPWAESISLWLARRIRMLRRFREQVENFWSATYRLLGRDVMIPATVLSALSWAMQCFALYLVIHALGRPATIHGTALVLSLSSVIGTVSLIPGGLGAIDGSLVILLARTGMSLSRAAAVTLVFRLLTLWLPMGIGALAVVGCGLRWPGTTPIPEPDESGDGIPP